MTVAFCSTAWNLLMSVTSWLVMVKLPVLNVPYKDVQRLSQFLQDLDGPTLNYGREEYAQKFPSM